MPRLQLLQREPGVARAQLVDPVLDEELAGFEYMLDASPLLIDKLRHHRYHVTGPKELTSVRELLAERFRAHGIPRLDLPTHGAAAQDWARRGLVGRVIEGGRDRHVVGWCRP